MEIGSGNFDLAAELQALRPLPQSEFTARLDARAATGFAKASEPERSLRRRLAERLHQASPRQILVPAAAIALLAIVVATAIVAADQRRGEDFQAHPLAKQNAPIRPQARQEPPPPASSRGGNASFQLGYAYSAAPHSSAGAAFGAAEGVELQSSLGPGRSNYARRDVERGAELVLHSEPAEVDANAQEVFAAVHAAHGIVLSSSIHGGSGPGSDDAGEPNANFQLLIPTARLSDTLASLSRIADVSARHESTLDITAPIVSTGARLKDSEATIDGLLAQLANAESSGERALVERQLRHERRHAAALRSQAERLRQRAHFAHVSLRIESGQTARSGSGLWGIDDAFGDAGHILSTAAGVAVIGLALVAPLAVVVLLAWLANRAWLRHRRERALG
jgi:hypothetical protein